MADGTSLQPGIVTQQAYQGVDLDTPSAAWRGVHYRRPAVAGEHPPPSRLHGHRRVDIFRGEAGQDRLHCPFSRPSSTTFLEPESSIVAVDSPDGRPGPGQVLDRLADSVKAPVFQRAANPGLDRCTPGRASPGAGGNRRATSHRHHRTMRHRGGAAAHCPSTFDRARRASHGQLGNWSLPTCFRR